MALSDTDIKKLQADLSKLEKRIAQLERGANMAPSEDEEGKVPPPPPAYKPSASSAPSKSQATNWEAVLGGNWLVKIGIAALVLGIGFFLKLAFDNGWIGPVGRILIGLVAGGTLVLLGERLQKKYSSYAQILTGGGIAILYVSIYAAYVFYSLIDSYLALSFMALVTALSGLLSVRYNKPAVAVIGILGGFITPFIFLKTLPEYLLIAYIIVLDYGIIGLSAIRNWRKLILVGMIGSFLDYLVWVNTAAVHPSVMMQEIVLTILFVIFAVSSVLWHFLWKKSAEDSDIIVITLNALSYFGISYLILQQGYREYLGIFTFLLAAFYAVLSYMALTRAEKDARLTLFLSGVSILFLTLTMPIQLHAHWITIAWAAEALVLIWLGFMISNFNYRVFGLIIYILVMFRLIVIDSFSSGMGTSYMPIFNTHFLPFAIAIVSLYGAVYVYSKNKKVVENKDEKSMVSVLLVAANFLTLWALTSEVIQYFNNKLVNFRNELTQLYNYQIMQVNRIQGNQEAFQRIARFQADISNIQNEENFAISFLWMAYSIFLIGVGFLKRVKVLRILGLIAFWITILKVFLFDMFQIGGTFRVASFITLGVILLITGYVYQRFSKKFKELLIAGIILMIFLTPFSHVFADFTSADWKYKKEIILPSLSQKQLVELPFDKGIYKNSSQDLHDLRIIDRDGAEIPYKFLIANTTQETAVVSSGIFNNNFIPGVSRSFIVSVSPDGKLHDSVDISVSEQNFRRVVVVETSNDGTNWHTATNKGVIYDYSDPAANLFARNTTVSYPESTEQFIRVTIQGDPLTVTTASVSYEKETQSQRVTYTPQLVENRVDESKKTTVVVADLGNTGLPNDTVTLHTKDTNFERDVLVEGSNDKTNWNIVETNNVIFSLQTPKFTGSNLTLTYPENTYRYLKVTIFNRDNTALTVEGITVSGIVRKLVFEANPADSYALFYGDTNASYPQYDIERYFQYLETQNLLVAKLGPEVTNDHYVEKLPPLPPVSERFPWLLPTILAAGILAMGVFVIRLIKTTHKKFPPKKRKR